jgi:hypothetical protein
VANALTAGTFLTSGGTFNGSAARTFAVDATDANTASKVVARDASGNFSAGTITATLSGAATSATTATNLAGGAANRIAYQTGAGATTFAVAPTASNQVLNWNGSAFTWSAGTISGIPLGSNLSTLTFGTYLTGTSYNGSTAVTIATNATNANTASTIVARDASGNFTAGTITAALSGNATTATTATTATNQSGGTVNATAVTSTGQVVINYNIATPANYYNALQQEIRATSGTAGIGLHRNGFSHCGIYHDATDTLKFNMNSGTSTLNATTGTIIGSGNVGTYAPSLTGSGASGTWGINVTGNAATATSATFLNSSNYINRTGSSGNANTDFQNTPAGSTRIQGDDAGITNGAGGSWWFYQNMRHSNGTNFWGTQVAWGWEDNANRLATRNVQGGGFGAWVYYLNSSNYTSYAPSLTGSGASGTWGINVTGSASTVTGVQTTFGQTGSGLNTSVGGQAGPQVLGTGGGGAVWTMHRPGAFGLNIGLDSDNVFRIGGWSASANRLQMDMSGNLTMAGNVTAYSDERLKKDWAPVAEDFVERLAKVKHGTYTRTDSEERQAGVSAQDWQKLLAETVLTSADGFLSVAYGNAALVAAVKLAERVVALEARLAAIEAKG